MAESMACLPWVQTPVQKKYKVRNGEHSAEGSTLGHLSEARRILISYVVLQPHCQEGVAGHKTVLCAGEEEWGCLRGEVARAGVGEVLSPAKPMGQTEGAMGPERKRVGGGDLPHERDTQSPADNSHHQLKQSVFPIYSGGGDQEDQGSKPV
jgi:hypothetical protein